MDPGKRSMFCLALLALAAIPVAAQPLPDREEPRAEAPRRYEQFAVDPNYEAFLKNRLQMERQLGPLKDLIKQVAADPKKYLSSPDKLKELGKSLKLDDPKTNQAVHDWVASDPDLKKALRNLIKQSPSEEPPAELKALQKQWKSLLEPAQKNPAEVEEPLKKLGDPPIPAPAKGPAEDPLARVAKNAMRQAEDTKLGDWLRTSPAWQRAFDDLQSSLKTSKPSQGGLGALRDKLFIPDEKFWRIGTQTLEILRDMPKPDLQRWQTNLHLPMLGRVALPNINGAALPEVRRPSLPSVGVGLSWLFFLVLLALGGWQWLRWAKRARRAASEGAGLGPWPVRPEMVSTRAELVQAFDYLALLTLGKSVKSWNHQAIARHWRELAPQEAQAASSLTLLYEQARYTDGAAALSEAQCAQARRSLQRLAEVL